MGQVTPSEGGGGRFVCVQKTKTLQKNYRLSHDVVTKVVDRDIWTAYCLHVATSSVLNQSTSSPDEDLQ